MLARAAASLKHQLVAERPTASCERRFSSAINRQAATAPPAGAFAHASIFVFGTTSRLDVYVMYSLNRHETGRTGGGAAAAALRASAPIATFTN